MKCFKKIFIIVFFSLLAGCHQQPPTITSVPDDILNQGINEVSSEAMQKIIENISSPVEIAALIKQMGIPFNKNYLSSSDSIANYNTALHKAFVLGIMGADLGYLNMYNKTGSVLENLSTIRELSNDLKIGQFFDFSSLKRLASSKSNIDSLMYISIHSFNEMDNYLRNNKRGNLSALMISGVWIEGLYLVTQVSKKYPDRQLIEKIGDQKIMLDNLMLILKNYSNDPNFIPFVTEIEKIKAQFSSVKISYELGEPEAVEKDGKLTIIQHEKSIINISESALKNITMVTEEIRNKMIKG